VGIELVVQGRQYRLEDRGRELFVLPLDQGGRHRIVLPDAAQADVLVRMFESAAGVAVLAADGGLLGGMSVAENLSLAMRYQTDVDAFMVRDWEYVLHQALTMCGLSAQRIESLGREPVMNLDRIDRWMVGLLRNVLRPPELLLLDRVFAGLSRRQVQAVLDIQAVFHEFHPFRPVLCIDVEGHELPAAPNYQQQLHLEAETPACPS
jgi:ABC-type lipopolysaccharide export system ATPase subunit